MAFVKYTQTTKTYNGEGFDGVGQFVVERKAYGEPDSKLLVAPTVNYDGLYLHLQEEKRTPKLSFFTRLCECWDLIRGKEISNSESNVGFYITGDNYSKLKSMITAMENPN